VVRSSKAFVVAAVLVAASAGCSSGAVSAQDAAKVSGGVTGALHRVHADADTQQFFQYGDVAGIKKVDGGVSAQAPLGPVFGFGAPVLGGTAFDVAGKTGIDLDQAVSTGIGAGPFGKSQVGLLYGTFDTSAIGAKLTALGYHSGDLGNGETLWSYQDTTGQDQPFPGAGHNFDAVRVSASRIVYGAAADNLAAMVGPGPTLADDPAYAAIGDCLGSAKVALIVRNPGTGRLVGYGTSATSAADEAELLCIPSASPAAAQALAAKWPSAVATTNDGQEAWSTLLSSPSAKVLGGSTNVVRLSAHGKQAGAIMNRWGEGEVGSLLGALDPTLGQTPAS
jgi:hypothetical protein